MSEYVAKTWGWDLNFQREGFWKRFQVEQFQIVNFDDCDVGVLYVEEKTSECFIELILIAPGHQKQGIGAAVVEQLQARCEAMKIPIALSVLKINPALQFYTRLGFKVVGDDSTSYKLKWGA